MFGLPVLNDQVASKKVIVRLDLDVPFLENGTIEDETRLLAGVDTINFLLKQNAQIIICGHLGRPDLGNKDSFAKLSLKPVASWFSKRYAEGLPLTDRKFGDFPGWQITEKIFFLENLRFFVQEEQSDTPEGLEFIKNLASFAQIYVNDAFAVCHRKHASIIGLPSILPHFAGLHLQKEIEALSNILERPERPLVVIIGGAKLETKLPLVEKMHQLADYVLVGGKIAWETKTLLQVQHEKLNGKKSALLIADLNQELTDMTDKSIENFLQIINLSKSLVWNGPVGQIEDEYPNLGKGTRELARGIVESGIYSIVGGGDTVGFLRKEGILNKFSFVSTGGGSMLDFLSGAKLPGIEALLKN